MADSHVDPKGHENNNKNYITKKIIDLKNCIVPEAGGMIAVSVAPS